MKPYRIYLNIEVHDVLAAVRKDSLLKVLRFIRLLRKIPIIRETIKIAKTGVTWR